MATPPNGTLLTQRHPTHPTATTTRRSTPRGGRAQEARGGGVGEGAQGGTRLVGVPLPVPVPPNVSDEPDAPGVLVVDLRQGQGTWSEPSAGVGEGGGTLRQLPWALACVGLGQWHTWQVYTPTTVDTEGSAMGQQPSPGPPNTPPTHTAHASIEARSSPPTPGTSPNPKQGAAKEHIAHPFAVAERLGQQQQPPHPPRQAHELQHATHPLDLGPNQQADPGGKRQDLWIPVRLRGARDHAATPQGLQGWGWRGGPGRCGRVDAG